MPYTGQNQPVGSGDDIPVRTDPGFDANPLAHVLDGRQIAQPVIHDRGHDE
jgi:hypothetical protein